MQQRVPGHRKITIKTDGPQEAVRWDSLTSRRASELHAIADDLDFVASACERGIRLHAEVDKDGSVRDEVGVRAYWNSAVIAYGRCFDSPGRLVLTEDDARAVGMLDEHRRFMDMRHLHVAHRIDPHWERGSAGIHLSPREVQPHKILGVSLIYQKMISVQPDELAELRHLAFALRSRVLTAVEAAIEDVLREAATRGEALYNLPATSSPDVETTPMQSVKRGRKGKKGKR